MVTTCQIDQGARRLLWVGKDRTKATLRDFFTMFGEARSKAVQFVASDMWKPYLDIIKQQALRRVLDLPHALLGSVVSRQVVPARHAVTPSTAQAVRQDTARPQAAADQLVPSASALSGIDPGVLAKLDPPGCPRACHRTPPS